MTKTIAPNAKVQQKMLGGGGGDNLPRILSVAALRATFGHRILAPSFSSSQVRNE